MIGLLALLSLLLMAAFNKVSGTPREEAQGPDQPVAVAAPAIMESDGPLPALISEYVFLHQARDESLPVHAMAGAKFCPE